ncbi:peptidylprolyl isomerase [Acidisphaera sp. S103]|uniref:peptidylprolyl isomerase n=1 Tax=Acidisphaera sp. S103 TaxID=1747223 RepID=UPI00131C06BF|nr:peptidyl-prolyl cis-trans isomerase [Acidisphaera sp. S103]
MTHLHTILAGIALAGFLGAAGPAPQPTDVVAQVGTTTLTVADVQAMLAHIDPAVRDQALHNHVALDELVRGQLIRQELLVEAEAKKWDQDADVAYRAKTAHDAAIVDSYLASLNQPDASYPSDADVQAAYEANKTRFVKPREYHLAQIVFTVPADAPKSADTEAQKKLRELKQTLSRPHADFADTAKHVSQDKATAEKGGEIGWVRDDQLIPAIKDAVAGLQDNAISDPVRAADGWHLLKLLDTKPATTATLVEVKDKLVQALRQQKESANARAYLQQMQTKQPLELNEIALSHVAAP